MRIDVFPHVLHKARKNGRFTYEPSVLCCTLAKAAEAAKENFSAIDFLLRGRLARESWRAGAADTGRDKAEEGGIPAVVFRPTTTQDVPASVRLRGCASRANRPFFLLKRKEGGRFLFLKKRNKRHCGADVQSKNRCFSVLLPASKKRAVHIRTVRFVLHVGESGRSGEGKLSRTRLSFAFFSF